MSILVTGFGPFLDHAENPSAVLAETCGRRFEVIEVSYRAVDEFVSSVSDFNAWLALGLGAKAETMLAETVGRNEIGPLADVRGEAHGPAPIDPTGPHQVAATLWHGVDVESEDVRTSVDAGTYLCNYLLYRAVRAFPEKRIGFLHVPTFDKVPFARQLDTLAAILSACEAALVV